MTGVQTCALPISLRGRSDDEREQLSFFGSKSNPAVEELKKLDLMEVSPSKAINILEKLKEMIDD